MKQQKSSKKETPICHYYLSSKDRDILIPKQQAKCLFYLAQGKSIKEISNIVMHSKTKDPLSERTVGSYIKIVQFKLNCYTKTKLLNTHGLKTRDWIF